MPTGRSELRYKPHLDGLRCVAVYLVLAYHAGPSFFSSGFIGVDVFFVLSGYLVTRILLRDLSTLHRADFRRFYSRRVRRILPAASVVLLVTAIAYSRVYTPLQTHNVLGGFRAAFLYFANWHFISQSLDYFAPKVGTSPVLQFWSLSVEEQFYLLWPLALTLLFLATARIGRMRWMVVRAVIGCAAIASVVEAVHLAATNPDRAYYGTDTRAYQLLAGALLALTPQLFGARGKLRRFAPWASGLALAGLVLAATSVLHLGLITRGITAVGLTSVLLIAVETARGGMVKRALSLRPITYLGALSYGTYLWHWPVVVIATHNRHIGRPALFVLTCTLATALAALSYHVLEHPIRISSWLNRYKVRVIAAGLSVSALGGFVLAPAILNQTGAFDALLRSKSQHLAFLQALARAPLPDCVGKPVEQCTVVKGTGLRVVLMGDSHARMWIPAFTEIAKKESWTFSVTVLNECPWQQHLQYGASNSGVRDNCRRHQDDWYQRVIPELKPDLVIVTHQSYDQYDYKALMALPTGLGSTKDPTVERQLRALTVASVHSLEADGSKVAIIEPIVLAPGGFDPLNCLSAGGAAAKCQYRVDPAPSPLTQFYRSIDDHEHTYTFNFDRLVCPRLPICDPIVNGQIVKRDGAHLTVSFAQSLAPAIGTAFGRAGLLR